MRKEINSKIQKSKENDKIEFEELVKEYKIKNVEIFVLYLKEIYRDLSQRSNEIEIDKIMNSITFSNYYELPGIISSRLFAVFDKDNDNNLNIDEFVEGMLYLFTGNYEYLTKFVFDFYDFDKDNFISKEDVRTVLSYIPLNTEKKGNSHKLKFEKETFKDRVESQEELLIILEHAFDKNETLDLNQFLSVVENVCSDIFLFVLIFLYENRPFTKMTLENYQKAKSIKGKSSVSIKSKSQMLPSTIKLIVPPNINSKFFPSVALSKSPVLVKKTISSKSNDKNKIDLAKKLLGKNKHIPESTNFILKYTQGVNNENKNGSVIKDDMQIKSIPVIRKSRHYLKDIDLVHTDSSFSVNKNHDEDLLDLEITPAVKYKIQNKFNFSSTNLSDLIEKMKIEEDKTDEEADQMEFEGYLYKITNSKKMKKLWFKLLHKDLYYYKSPEDLTHKGMHNLSGVQLKEEKPIEFKGTSYYSFALVYPNRSKILYADNETEYKKWIESIRKLTGYKNLKDIYEVKEKLGNGKFGLVRLGIHKQSKRKVAVKIICKADMSTQDLDLVKTEIEILKVCQHPNIIRLYDVFENINYIYIIMEYCSGGDLFSYLEKRNFKVSEKRASEIIHKICAAVYYIHSYGIAHRDLKPENIMMTDESDKADVKILDFGLSKIIGPNEFCNEPFGTLSYVAPEVLFEKPYTKAVDLWSIGIITYLLLTGCLPFDHEYSEKEVARQTMYDPVPFPVYLWKDISPEAKDFVTKLIQKDPYIRMTITNALEHPWLQKHGEFNLSELRIKGKDMSGSSFKFYTSTEADDNLIKNI